MENRPVISFNFRSPYPGADPKAWERNLQWGYEAWAPMTMKTQWPLGIDGYLIVREQPEYPVFGDITHYKSLKDWQDAGAASEFSAVQGDIKSWADRKIAEYIWSAVYALTKSYRSRPDVSENIEDTLIENAPIMHLEAYRLSPEQQEKYLNWFIEYGYPIFIPLFIKQPGLVGYDWYEYTSLHRHNAREVEYPRYLSIVYFENLNAFENFIKSPELAGFQRAMRSVFPNGLKYEWNIQYQLVKSFKK